MPADASRPNEAAPVTLEQLREALAFVTEQYNRISDGTTNIFVWLWEAIQGDFNQERTTGQIVFDTAISIIPGVDQVCDVRDIIANCKQINEDKTNNWAWVGLGLTLIGLFPSLGSLVKGVLKIFFLFVRRSGGRAMVRLVDEAMTWVITFLRKREVQRYWKGLKWDRLFMKLAESVRAVRAKVNVGQLLSAFDRGIMLMNNLVGYVRHLPFVGDTAVETVKMVRGIRDVANQYLAKAVKPLQDALDTIARRLEVEDLLQRPGKIDAGNVHFTGGLPEGIAVRLMRTADPLPKWLSKGLRPLPHPPLEASDDLMALVKKKSHKNVGFPALEPWEVKTFSKSLKPDVIIGPQRLYRIVSPSNFAAGADWMSEEVFKKIMHSSDPKAAWRKYLGVWPDWNPNGQFVIYDIPKGQELKVWRGPAASQIKEDSGLDAHLEGGWEQIKFHASKGPGDSSLGDTASYHRAGSDGRLSKIDMTREEYKALSDEQKMRHQYLREKINHPNISGPFDTKWGATDFDSQMFDAKLGLPHLPGQSTNTAR